MGLIVRSRGGGGSLQSGGRFMARRFVEWGNGVVCLIHWGGGGVCLQWLGEASCCELMPCSEELYMYLTWSLAV